MTYFDTDGDGNINFDEFLVGVRVSHKIISQVVNHHFAYRER
jgi:hypothetical protein